MSSQIVHALLRGQPLCGFSTDVPARWPAGHVWTNASDLSNINCIGCKQKAEEMAKPTERATTAISEKGIAQVGDTEDCEAGGIVRI
jgi:hypothetical protein